jgi:hypothetical protein
MGNSKIDGGRFEALPANYKLVDYRWTASLYSITNSVILLDISI